MSRSQIRTPVNISCLMSAASWERECLDCNSGRRGPFIRKRDTESATVIVLVVAMSALEGSSRNQVLTADARGDAGSRCFNICAPSTTLKKTNYAKAVSTPVINHPPSVSYLQNRLANDRDPTGISTEPLGWMALKKLMYASFAQNQLEGHHLHSKPGNALE